MSNSDNPRVGAEFQSQVRDFFECKYGKKFHLEEKIAIGFEPDNLKEHKFDIVSADGLIVVECKRYTWTASGNVPSAKMGFTNEAAFYLSFLPSSITKYIVMFQSFNAKRGETLAEYYYKTNKHLLKDVLIAEFNPDSSELRIINKETV